MKNIQHRVIRTSNNELRNYHTSTCHFHFFSSAKDSEVYGSTALPTQPIMEANKEVQLELLRTEVNKWYSSTLHAETAKYACQHGAAALHGVIRRSWRNH